MNLLTISTIEKIMLIITYSLGFLAIIMGIAILVYGVWGRDIRTLASQTTRLAQKGLADEVSGLVGNASVLLTTINEMVRTSTGIGLYLTLMGIILIGIAFYVTFTFFI